MQPPFLDDAEEWLVRSERDLEVAVLALQADPPLGDAVAYHAQQAAEKALKGFLVAHGKPFEKTHLLEHLVGACDGIDPRFRRFTQAAETLTPYAVEFRYPGARLEPPESEARIANQHSTEILEFVRAVLADAGSPPASR